MASQESHTSRTLMSSPRSSHVYQSVQTTPKRPSTSHRSRKLRERQDEINTRSNTSSIRKWSEDEISALVEGIVTFHNNSQWPTHHNTDLWNTISFFVKMRSHTSFYRSGEACRYKVITWLKKRFNSPSDASIHYQSHLTAEDESHTVSQQLPQVPLSQINQSMDTLPLLADEMQHMSVDPLCGLSKSFQAVCSESFNLELPEDFLVLCVQAMLNLRSNGKCNVLYNVAKGFGTMRADGSDTRFPMKRMPMGLLEYTTNFFVAENVNQIPRCPSDYRLWLATMYSQFGNKWAKLHHGPLWSVTNTSQRKLSMRDTMEALVNIPAISEATLRRDIAACDIFLNSKIQLSVLDEAKSLHPDSWWWVKADACDLVAGLGTSVEGKWSGDVNMHCDDLQKCYDDHLKRVRSIKDVDISAHTLCNQITKAKVDLKYDATFIDTTLKKLHLECEKAFAQDGQEKSNLKLTWEITELTDLNTFGRQLLVDSSIILDNIEDPTYDRQANNFSRKLSNWKQRMVTFVERLVKFRRTAATHILVVLISPEQRSSKPYALPVQAVAYKGMKDNEIRSICSEVVRTMVSRGMKVAGFTTNGEFNSLRSKGYSRPLSIFEIRSSVRRKISKWSQKNMIKMLSPSIQLDGKIQAELPNPAVSDELLREILIWLTQGQTKDNIIDTLRNRCVPRGYKYNTWRKGISESLSDKLKSILAQLEYVHQINLWEDKGVPFKTHMHVPEVNSITGTLFCEREDEGHVLKRIGNSLRQGRDSNLRLERFVEALKDKSAGLTYSALTGIRKQSVEDVERFFGYGVIQFMEKKGYTYEAKYLKTVRNWRRAVDERGLSEEQRQQFDMDFLQFIGKGLIPWYSHESPDFSKLEVNRSIDDVRGLTKETLIALAADMETRNSRRIFLKVRNHVPEHPRASTTDDVECFFSVLRDMVGKDFTLKQVYFGWRKVCLEFMKRMDPDLPFYYSTSTHSRFYEGDLPSFNDKEDLSKKKRSGRLPQRELLSSTGHHVSIPVRGSLSVRAKFHNIPVELPPLPDENMSTITMEHSYC